MTAFAQNLAILMAAIGVTWIVVQSFKLVANGLAAIAKRSPRAKATSPKRSWLNDHATGGASNVASGSTSSPIEFDFNLERTVR